MEIRTRFAILGCELPYKERIARFCEVILARARETNRFRAKTIAKTQQAGERCRLASRSEATQAAVRGSAYHSNVGLQRAPCGGPELFGVCTPVLLRLLLCSPVISTCATIKRWGPWCFQAFII
jgi:hypothetical protein